jgi:hypothetical protein
MFGQKHYFMDTYQFGDAIKDWHDRKQMYVENA